MILNIASLQTRGCNSSGMTTKAKVVSPDTTQGSAYYFTWFFMECIVQKSIVTLTVNLQS